MEDNAYNIDAYKVALHVVNITQNLGGRLEAANMALKYLNGGSFNWVTFISEDADISNPDSPRIKVKVLAHISGEVRKADAWIDNKFSTDAACEILKGLLGE